MSEIVHWLIELKIAKENRAAFQALADEAVPATKQEQGCLGYDWNIADDGETVHIYECFKDSAAVLAHMENFGKFRDRFRALITPVSFTIYGSPNDAVRAAFAGRPDVRYFNSIAGFIR
jgi:quinol monooxygenase YgiN